MNLLIFALVFYYLSIIQPFMSTLHLQMFILHLLVNVRGLHRIINSCKLSPNQRYEIPKHFVILCTWISCTGITSRMCWGNLLLPGLRAARCAPSSRGRVSENTANTKRKSHENTDICKQRHFHRTVGFKMCGKINSWRPRQNPRAEQSLILGTNVWHFLPSHYRSYSAFFWSESQLKHQP